MNNLSSLIADLSLNPESSLFVDLAGRLGKSPVFKNRTTAEGKKTVAEFPVAVNMSKDKTVWLTVSAWEDKAERAKKLQKGQLVRIKGKLRVNSWVGRDGQTRQTAQLGAYYIES